MAIKNIVQVQKHLFICNGGTCLNKGAGESIVNIRQSIADEGLHDEVHTTKTLCNGRCNDGPIIISMPEGKWFKNITPENVNRFVKEYLVKQNGCKEFELFNYGDEVINVDMIIEKENT